MVLLVFNKNKENNIDYKMELLNSSKLIRHRGPDWSGRHFINYDNKLEKLNTKFEVLMGHERLSIIDPKKGSQPIIHYYDNENENDSTNTITLCVNGEIYNYKQLKSLWKKFNYQTDMIVKLLLLVISNN